MHTPQRQNSSLGILNDQGLFTQAVSPKGQSVSREQHGQRPEEELVVRQDLSGGGTGTIRHAWVAGQTNQRQAIDTELRPGKSGMSGYAGRRAARRAGGWSGGGGTGAEALVLRQDLELVVDDGAIIVIGRRVLQRVGHAAMAVWRPHLDLPLGRVARTLNVGDVAPVACRLALVALDAAGPTREAASARASLDLAHGEGLLPRGRGCVTSLRSPIGMRCLLERSELSVGTPVIQPLAYIR